MKLVEYRGKELLKRSGIRIPPGIVTTNKSYINLSYHKERYREFFFDQGKVVIKAQIIDGKRKKNGFIVESDDYEKSLHIIDSLYRKTYNGGNINTLLIEKKLTVKQEYFLSILYDTRMRVPVVLFSKQGGVDVEESSKAFAPIAEHVSPSEGLHDYQARSIAKKARFKGGNMLQIASFLMKAYRCFDTYDCRICEINPIVQTPEGLLFAADAKITIDDNAISRQEIFCDETDIEDRSVLNERETEARKIDYNDYRGVAGKTYLDLDGDIAVLASGGGGSLTCMDAIVQAGGKPANYTEYSGNPPREKVEKLTKITLSKPGLQGCLVVGGTANFTDIYETMLGFMNGLASLEHKPDYPIVIRRAGPRDKKAFAMIRKRARKERLNITLYGEDTPMSKAAHIFVDKTNAYKRAKRARRTRKV